jgi:hypothetical protein
MVESMSMVMGPPPGPAPAAQARVMAISLRRSNWRTWPKLKERRKVPARGRGLPRAALTGQHTDGTFGDAPGDPRHRLGVSPMQVEHPRRQVLAEGHAAEPVVLLQAIDAHETSSSSGSSASGFLRLLWFLLLARVRARVDVAG